MPTAAHQALMTVKGLRSGRTEARERLRVEPVPDEVIERTLPHVSSTVAAIVRLQRLTGMRPQEVVHMRAGELDRSDPVLWTYRPGRHENQHRAKDRVIYLGERTQRVLTPFLGLGPEEYLFSPRRAEEERRAALRARRRSPLTLSQRGRVSKSAPERAPGDLYDDGSYRKAIRRACLKLGIPVWFPHQVRHTAATEFRRLYGLEASQALLGHSELGTTQIYAVADRTAARRVMREIG